MPRRVVCGSSPISRTLSSRPRWPPGSTSLARTELGLVAGPCGSESWLLRSEAATHQSRPPAWRRVSTWASAPSESAWAPNDLGAGRRKEPPRTTCGRAAVWLRGTKRTGRAGGRRQEAVESVGPGHRWKRPQRGSEGRNTGGFDWASHGSHGRSQRGGVFAQHRPSWETWSVMIDGLLTLKWRVSDGEIT